MIAQLETGFEFGLLVSAFIFGFRHGIDWDHIAAITDITSSQGDRRRALFFGTLYVLGHALVVFALGVLAIVAGDRLPQSIDRLMGRIVGVTLILLGIYVFVSLVRHGRDFRLRSRWMLIFAGVRKGVRWLRRRIAAGREARERARETGRVAVAVAAAPSLWHHGHHGRPGHHHHDRPEADEDIPTYGRGTAFLVGMIHGVGAETPTQVVIFLTAAGAGGPLVGVLVLASFIVGLVISNSVITVGSSFGYLHASRNFALYATVAVVTAVFSLVIGALFVLGQEGVLPAFFGA
jgi:cytochrome c biogenesis protein CcdA